MLAFPTRYRSIFSAKRIGKPKKKKKQKKVIDLSDLMMEKKENLHLVCMDTRIFQHKNSVRLMHTGRMGLNIFSPVIITILNCSEREDHHWLICVYCNQRETRQQQQQKTQMEKAIFFPGRASFLKIKKKKLSFCCVIDMIMTKVSRKK